MENSERKLIRDNFVHLAEYTKCKSRFLNHFYAKRILTADELQEIESKSTSYKRSSLFYKIIQTRINAFPTLLNALELTCQNGALQILLDGLGKNDIVKTTLGQDHKSSFLTNEDTEFVQIINSKWLELAQNTNCTTEFLMFFHERKILTIDEIQEITIDKSKFARAMQFYDIIKTRENAFSVLIEGLKKYHQSTAIYVLTEEEDKEVEISEEEKQLQVQITFERTKLNSNITFGVQSPISTFTGRSKDLPSFHQLVLKSKGGDDAAVYKPTVVWGPEGIGKTEFVRLYCREKKKDFDGNVIWLKARSRRKFENSFKSFASILQIQFNDGLFSKLVENVYKHFNETLVLFVFDDCTNQPWLQEFLPDPTRSATIYVVITSTSNQWGIGVNVFNLGELSLEEGIMMVKKALGIPENDNRQDEDIQALVKTCNGVPRELQQTISSIQNKNTTETLPIREYMMSTTNFWKYILKTVLGDTKYGKIIENILSIVAYLNPEKISRWIIGESLLSVMSDFQGKVEGALELLQQKSFLKIDANRDVKDVNRKAQEIIRNHMVKNEKEQICLERIFQLLGTGNSTNIPNEVVAHLLTAWRHSIKYPSIFYSQTSKIYDILLKIKQAGRCTDGIQLGLEAAKVAKAVFGERHIEYYNFNRYVANCLCDNGQYNQSKEILFDIAKNAEAVLGDNNGTYLLIERDLAKVLNYLGQYESAVKIDESVFSKRVKYFGENHEDTLNAQNNYAVSLINNRKLDEALDILKNLHNMYALSKGENHIYSLNVRINIATIYDRKGEYEEALTILKDVYERMVPIWMEEVDTFAHLCFSLGVTLKSLGKNDEALAVYQHNFEKIKQKLGPNHYRTIRLLNAIEGEGSNGTEGANQEKREIVRSKHLINFFPNQTDVMYRFHEYLQSSPSNPNATFNIIGQLTNVDRVSELFRTLQINPSTSVIDITKLFQKFLPPNKNQIKEIVAKNTEMPSTTNYVPSRSNLEFRVLPPIGNFTWRKVELKQLHDYIFDTDNLVCISGLGGIGKTQLVRQFFKEHGHEFNGNCIWMNAKSEHKVIKGFFHLSRVLQISVLDPTGKRVYSKELVPAVYANLKTSKVLIVFDNVEEESWLTDYLPKNDEEDCNFKTVVISRKRSKIVQGRSLHVEGLSIEDSMQLITHELNLRDSLDLPRILALRFNGFPVALQQAISYIKHHQSMSKEYSLQTYLQELDQTLIEKLSFNPNSLRGNLSIENDYKETSITALQSSLDQIADTPEIGNLCTWILNLSAYLCNDKIRKDLFYNVQPNTEVFNLQLNSGMRLISKNSSPFYINSASEIVTEKNVERALNLLNSYSIINYDQDQETFNINGLLQELIRIKLKSNKLEVLVLTELIGILRNEKENKESLEHIDHCKNVWSHAWNYAKILEEHSLHLVEVVCLLEKLEGVSKALSFGRNVSNKIKEHLGEDHKAYFKIQIVLASILANSGSNAAALEEIISLLEKCKYESDDMRLLTLQGYQASILRNMGRFEEASNIFLNIYERKRNILGYTHVETLKAQENYAVSLLDCGYFDKALSIHLKTCKILIGQFGANHISVFQARNNLGYVYFKKGNNQKAFKIFEDIYPKIVQNLDKDVELFTNICLNYIQVLVAMGKYSIAKDIGEESHNMVKGKFGEFHRIALKFKEQINNFGKS